MAFEPFGFHFEVVSPMPPAKVKSAIRARKKGWLDSKQGARGWLLGPFTCLWLNAFSRSGPMLLGRISPDGFGTRISGRAGSDLNGLVGYSIVVAALALFFAQPFVEGDMSARQMLLIGGLIAASPLMLWWSHQDRKEAEPLVRFLRDTIAPPGSSLRLQLPANASLSITMSFNGDTRREPATGQAIFEELQSAMPGDFLILSAGEEEYIQTLAREGGFVIEKREGSSARHFKAVASGKPLDLEGFSLFTYDETLATLIAYASGSPMPPIIRWEPMDLTK